MASQKLPDYKVISKLVIFGQIGYLSNFPSSNVHLEFWLENDAAWKPFTDDQLSLIGVSSKCFSPTHITHIGCPFEFTLLYSDERGDESHLSSATIKLYVRIVKNHGSGRESSEAFGCLVFPLKAGHYKQTIDTYKPFTNSLKDKLIEQFFDYSFDLHNLKQTEYHPIGLINSESKGSFTVDFNVILQKNKINLDLYDKESVKSNISQIVKAFRQARQRLIWLKMKAFNFT